jgi:hypothetical protein
MKTIEATNKVIKEKNVVVMERVICREMSVDEFNDYVSETTAKKEEIKRQIEKLKLDKEMTPKFKDEKERRKVMSVVNALKDNRIAQMAGMVMSAKKAEEFLSAFENNLEMIEKESEGLEKIK